MPSRKDLQLFERRQEDEASAALREASFASRFTEGAPDLPHAQLVHCPPDKVGVAVQGAAKVCLLPNGYSGPHLKLALIDRGRLIVTHPDLPPLVIDPQRGTTQPL